MCDIFSLHSIVYIYIYYTKTVTFINQTFNGIQCGQIKILHNAITMYYKTTGYIIKNVTLVYNTY